MRRLRKKMPNLSIETIYGYGYRLLGWKRIYQFQVNY
jgi:DNA-binding response OmpR family regulator